METTSTAGQATHGANFRTVNWFGRQYAFTPAQAACVSVLWRAWLGGTPIIREEFVLQTAGVQARSLREVFRKGSGCSAWGAMIGDGDRRGSVRLVEPPADRAE